MRALKFEDLSTTEQDEWNSVAGKFQKQFRAYYNFYELKKCFLCRKVFLKGIVSRFFFEDKKPIGFVFSGEYLAHLKMTHGIPAEDNFFSDKISSLINNL